MDEIEARLRQIPHLLKLIREDGEETTRFTAVVEEGYMFLMTIPTKVEEGHPKDTCVFTYVAGDREIQFQDLFSLDDAIEVIERVTTLKHSITYDNTRSI